MKIATFTSDTKITDDSPYSIGIDPSLTGYAVCAMDAAGNFEARVYTPLSRGSERLASLRKALLDFLFEFPPADVAMESTVLHSKSASVLGEVSGITKEALFSEHNIVPTGVPPMTLKKYVCGTGKATKAHIMMSTLKKWGLEIPDDNAADAHGLARICAGLSDTAYEAEIVLRMSDIKYRL